MNVNKLLYRPLGLLFGVLGGLAANAVFEQVWKLISGTNTPAVVRDLAGGV
ncbi:DUF4235 domain-containing protein, partial [Amycolatopsis sp. CFH S0740]|uniref:DUF4235 domain-containing protein n=1 Tax=Amycolatopsis sp. CFH S0740 TaxID=1644111 RepID=UPI00106F9CC4